MTRELLIEGINSLYERGEFEKHKDRKSFPVKDEKGNYVEVTFEKNGDEINCTFGRIFKKHFVVKESELTLLRPEEEKEIPHL